MERREMLAVSVDDFHLLEDTGLSQTDLMTSNPTVTGTVHGDFAGGHVQLEFDHNSDGYSEGYVTVYTPGGAFTYDPRWYDYSVAMHTGSFTLNYRAVEYDSMASVVSTSEWQSFTFTIGRPEISVVQQLDGYTYVVEVGMGWLSFGSAAVGAPVEKLLTITNVGLELLTLDVNWLSVPSGFSAPTVFSPSLAPGESTALALRLDAAEAGDTGGMRHVHRRVVLRYERCQRESFQFHPHRQCHWSGEHRAVRRRAPGRPDRGRGLVAD